MVLQCGQNKHRLLRSFAGSGYVPYVEELLAAGAKSETTDQVKREDQRCRADTGGQKV